MDSQFIANLISGISALATVVAAIYTRRQAIGSKEAKAKAEESHKAALDMRDAAQRSAKAAEEQANQAELARKAAEERAQQAEKSLKQMQQIVAEQQSQSQSQSKIAANLWRPKFQLTHVREIRYKLQNISEHSLDVLKVVNQNEFFRCDDINQQFNPGESLDILLGGAGEIPLPSNLILQVAGRNEPIHVQIPGKSG
ncbi:cell envelope integrity protein TolA [uncultured Rothia sp.]|uniref:cell envelope integrity protein TolA n=1 Tax=uncultured Rothia sp. TaxID=316088 RepID=UPI0025DEAC1C|nr:cell envelope integrity protein TolA [uncultured Rothia sp.]